MYDGNLIVDRRKKQLHGVFDEKRDAQHNQEAEAKQAPLPGPMRRVDEPGQHQSEGDCEHREQGFDAQPKPKAGQGAAGKEDVTVVAVS